MTQPAGQGRRTGMTVVHAFAGAAVVIVAACSSPASSSPSMSSTAPTMSGAGMTSTVPPGSPSDGACQALDEQACDASTECRSVFEVSVTAWDAKTKHTKVSPRYAGCRLGHLASCKKPGMACDAPDPACEAAGLQIQWVGGCHEGCVRSANCET